ncbi:YoaK family protein [Flavobacterium sp. XGLA_31]|uniref:YoaK family protein n=1 Tax=Flavobacterium sp. XGLA_31 TaxID=3447666 RepID=UPI003F37DF71
MFRHHGKNRTFIHNLRLATLLSLVAGMVNITGVLALKTLTTNVTGHFAFFAEEFLQKDYAAALTFLVFILFFLLGSFTANLLAEWLLRRRPHSAHILPVLIEMTVLIAVGYYGTTNPVTASSAKIIAFAMLFAMGVQNALVTKISQSTVRTTHLTGLFTDLGIELSQLFFYKKTEEVKRLRTSIYLRFSIIIFFFIGCIGGGLLYQSYQMKTLFVASFILLIALLYDYFRLQLLAFRRKSHQSH